MNEREKLSKYQETGFWRPKQITYVSYVIDCQVDPAAGRLQQGHEAIEIEDQAEESISPLALKWSLDGDQTVEIVAAEGRRRFHPR